MSFWSTSTAEPKRKFRWKIIFSGAGGISSLSYALKKADKPKGKVLSTTHKYLNHNFNYPGRFEWEDINLTFASVSQPDATFLINQVLTNAGYGVPKTAGNTTTNKRDLATMSKRKFNGALGTFFNLIQINPEGETIEEWKVWNPFFTSINYGDLDYSSEDIVDIQVGVKYDYAQLMDRNSNNPVDKNTPFSPGFPTP